MENDAIATGQTSVEKVAGALTELESIDTGGDEQTAQLLAAAKMVGLPQLVARMLPQEPGELDELIERGANLFLRLRSDSRQPLGIFPVDHVGELTEHRPPEPGAYDDGDSELT